MDNNYYANISIINSYFDVMINAKKKRNDH